jgi:hypothetical protein
MYGTNLNAEPNFHLQAFNQYGIKYVTGPYTSYNLDVFRAFTATTDCVITATAVVGDSLTNEIIYAGTTVYGLFISIVVTSGNAVLHLAEPSVISELVNSYYNTAAQYGYYSEAQACTSERLNPYLAGGLYDKASWLLIPSQVEEDFVRAFKPADNSGSLSFTRASDATRTNAAGEIERTPWNLVTWSEMFSDVAWLKVNTTITPNTTIAPNGTLTANTLSGDGTFNAHLLAQTGGGINGVTYTHSVYAKKGSNNFIQLTGTGAIYTANNVFANFDLNNGVVGSVGAGSTATITNVGNGWYRCTMTATATATASGSALLLCLPSSATSARAEPNSLTTNVFIWGAQLVEGTDAKPYFPTTNRLDVPRLDYRNADGTLNSCPRLLLEPQRTNLVTFSEQFNNAAWGASVGITILADQGISPAGTNTMDLITFPLSGTFITQSVNVVSGSSYTFSVWLATQSGTQSVEIGNVNIGTWQAFTVTTTPQRFQVTQVASGTTRFPGIRGTGAYSVLAWGAQLELGAYATTFIPTTTAAVTRLVDAAFKTGVASLIGQTEGTVFVDFNSSNVVNSSNSIFCISNGSTTSRVLIYLTSNLIAGQVRNAAVTQAVFAGPTMAENTTYKCAIAYNNDDVAFYINGVQIGVDNSATIPAMSDVRFDNGAGTSPCDVPINQAAIFPTRLSNEELVTITTL